MLEMVMAPNRGVQPPRMRPLTYSLRSVDQRKQPPAMARTGRKRKGMGVET